MIILNNYYSDNGLQPIKDLGIYFDTNLSITPILNMLQTSP